MPHAYFVYFESIPASKIEKNNLQLGCKRVESSVISGENISHPALGSLMD